MSAKHNLLSSLGAMLVTWSLGSFALAMSPVQEPPGASEQVKCAFEQVKCAIEQARCCSESKGCSEQAKCCEELAQCCSDKAQCCSDKAGCCFEAGASHLSAARGLFSGLFEACQASQDCYGARGTPNCKTISITAVSQANCDTPSQCCVVGCQECQFANFAVARDEDDNIVVFGSAPPMHSHYIFRPGQPIEITKGISRCSFDAGNDQGCCEVRRFERSCGERTICTESACQSSESECGQECAEACGIHGCQGEGSKDVELIVAEWDEPSASQQVAVPLHELLELCAERARWEAKAEAVQEILETRMASLERMLVMQQESHEKVLELTVKNARLETMISMGGNYPAPGMQPGPAMAQGLPQGLPHWLPYGVPYGVSQGEVLVGVPMPNTPARLASHRPMPIPFAPSAHQCAPQCAPKCPSQCPSQCASQCPSLGSHATQVQPVVAREASCAQPCCEEGTHCCQDESGKASGSEKSKAANPEAREAALKMGSELRLRFEASRKVP